MSGDKPTDDHKGHRQRLRERFLKSGEALPDYELLELLLCLAQPRGDVKPQAKALMKEFGSFAAVISAEPAHLTKVPGVGEAAVTALKLAREAAARLLRDDVMDRPILTNWQRLLDYCRATMAHEKAESFRILFLNAKNTLIADEVQQTGTVNHTPVYPREVIKRALDLGASAVILVHNHPSGDPEPSKDDIQITRDIRDAGQKLGIGVHDHVIVARGGVTSFKSRGLL